MEAKPTPEHAPLPQRVAQALKSQDQAGLQAALEAIARDFGAVTATLHRADTDAQLLHMVAYMGLPEKLLPITQRIPFGKGMAGLCAARREPVTVCNLQTDDSGQARPSAKLTGVEGAINMPIFRDDQFVGTLGIGKPAAHDYTDAERALLAECTHLLAPSL
jgi:L-methionine (R)-S-oxide reductase